MKAHSYFNTYVIGVVTNRDAWVSGFSQNTIKESMHRMIDYYNNQRVLLSKGEIAELGSSETDISWTVNLKKDAENNVPRLFDNQYFIQTLYRPFCKVNLYYDKPFIERPGLWNRLFPAEKYNNLVISVSGVGQQKPFSSLISNSISDLQVVDKAQYFPLYWYDESTADIADLFNQASDEEVMDRYIRRDGVSDWILRECRQRYGNKVSKEDIFYYVYGILHSPEYRTTFEADLKKMLPRLPLVDTPDMFMAFSKAGRDLAELHLNYETVQPYEGVSIKTIGTPTYEVVKMRFGKKDSKTADKSTIIYNNNITIESIPLEAYDYVVNGKSALEWIMERYQITTDAKSGITNNPNDWSKEHGDEKYIFNLVLRIITVSLETMKIVNALPKLKFE